MVFVRCDGKSRTELYRYITSIHDNQLFAGVYVLHMHFWYFFIFINTAINELKSCKELLWTAVNMDDNDSTSI